MKYKIHIFALILFFTSTVSFAQTASKIKPVKIVWVADGDTLTIDEAQTKGVKVPSKLEIVAILNSRTIGNNKNQKLEFRWYKQAPTRLYLTNSFYKKLEPTGALAYPVSTSRVGLRAGWWKVQIESYSDRKLLSYKNKQEFWIKLK